MPERKATMIQFTIDLSLIGLKNTERDLYEPKPENPWVNYLDPLEFSLELCNRPWSYVTKEVRK